MNVVNTYELMFTEKEVRFLLDYIESTSKLFEKYNLLSYLDSNNRQLFDKAALTFFKKFKIEEFPFEEIDELDYELEKSAKLEQLEETLKEIIRNNQRKE